MAAGFHSILFVFPHKAHVHTDTFFTYLFSQLVHIVKCLQCKIQLEVHVSNTARRSHAKVLLPALIPPCTVKITACI